jgi:hypothetical protein
MSFELIARSDSDDVTLITARDDRGRVWVWVATQNGFERMVEPDGTQHDAWTAHEQGTMTPDGFDFVDWMMTGIW